jgi:hypothetical protein
MSGAYNIKLFCKKRTECGLSVWIVWGRGPLSGRSEEGSSVSKNCGPGLVQKISFYLGWWSADHYKGSVAHVSEM